MLILTRNRWNEANYVKTYGTKYRENYEKYKQNTIWFSIEFCTWPGSNRHKRDWYGHTEDRHRPALHVRGRQHRRVCPERRRRPPPAQRGTWASWASRAAEGLAHTSDPWAAEAPQTIYSTAPTSDPSAPNPPTDILEGLGGALWMQIPDLIEVSISNQLLFFQAVKMPLNEHSR